MHNHTSTGLFRVALIQVMASFMTVIFISGDGSSRVIQWTLAVAGGMTVWMVVHALIVAPSVRRPGRFLAFLAAMAVGCVLAPFGADHLITSVLGFPVWSFPLYVVLGMVIVFGYPGLLVQFVLFPENVPAQPGA